MPKSLSICISSRPWFGSTEPGRGVIYGPEVCRTRLGASHSSRGQAIEDGSVGPLMKLVTDASEAVSENSFKRYLLQKASTEKDLRAGT